MARAHALLLGHGTVENLDDLPPFLANIRHGRPAPPELVSELRHRYQAIGGSPLLSISRELTVKLAAELNTPVHLAMRFWHPFLADVLDEAARAGADVVDVVPLAPFSAKVYEAETRRAAEENKKRGRAAPELRFAADWGTEPALVDAFAAALSTALAALDAEAAPHVFFTAHSLPLFVVQKGDRYPDAVAQTARAVADRARLTHPWRIVYQSQGATADPWLGPALRESLTDAAAQGARDVVVCPIGFLSDHVEILYDLDIEARQWADAAGLRLTRTASLNAGDALVRALGSVVRSTRSGSELGV
ncbi:MAG TPA: ferrochelatase [Polyangiaceae bacterium]|jgi:ferrochelatase